MSENPTESEQGFRAAGPEAPAETGFRASFEPGMMARDVEAHAMPDEETGFRASFEPEAPAETGFRASFEPELVPRDVEAHMYSMDAPDGQGAGAADGADQPSLSDPAAVPGADED